MQRKTGISVAPARAAAPRRVPPAASEAKAGIVTTCGDASSGAACDGLAAWLARYEPVEREIIEAHERRIASRERRRSEASRRFGDLCEATEGLAVVWRREGWGMHEMVRWADGDVLTLLTLARWLGAEASRYVDRAQSRLRRPLYYARERARREALAAERRRTGGRRTANPCPTREAILDAWIHRRDSHEAAVRFGSMVHDLECYVDNSLLRDEAGAIVGRRGGVKAWLQKNIPALYVRYTTVMRYKAMAKKLRQVVGLADPVPAEAVLEEEPDQSEAHAKAPGLAVVRARAVWLEVVAGVRTGPTALMERLDVLTDPERVEDVNMLAGWRAKYENEITERMKSRW